MLIDFTHILQDYFTGRFLLCAGTSAGTLVAKCGLLALEACKECKFYVATNSYVWRKYVDSLQWLHNEHDGISNHQPHDCLLNCLFKVQLKEKITGLCEGNSLVTGEFPVQRASNAESVSIWWRHHVILLLTWNLLIMGFIAHNINWHIKTMIILEVPSANTSRHFSQVLLSTMLITVFITVFWLLLSQSFLEFIK